MAGLRKTLLTERSLLNSKSHSVTYTPVHWSKYFDKQDTVNLSNGDFHYYTKGDSGPLLLAIHGGGFSGLTWSLFADAVTKKILCRVMAIDMRGHGSTQTNDDEDLSLEFMAKDVQEILETVYESNIPPTVLIGHSMGGAVAVQVTALIPSVVGVCVIDVAEGSALDSLSQMQSVLRSRPMGFASIEQAIEWDFRGGTTNNVEAARVSMPGQIISINSGKIAAQEIEIELNNVDAPKPRQNHKHKHPSMFRRPCTPPILEKSGADDELGTMSTSGSKMHSKPIHYMWRIDLTKTEKYWHGWFKGLSQKFLDLSQPKLLLMASIHGLDTCLTVGQMQGKFQLKLVPNCGHVIQEDCPEQVAEIVAAYLVKQKIAKAVEGFDAFMSSC